MNRTLLTLVLVAMLAAACSVARPSTGAATAPDGQSTGPTETLGTSGPSAQPTTTDEPATVQPTETPSPTQPPTEAPTVEPAGSAAPPASAAPAASAGADVCTGTQNNRDFFEKVARDLDWTVLCAVLPRGWSVQNGEYRLASGGWMRISYKSRAGATLALSEGAFCGSADGCVPAGADVGDAAYGPMTGTLVALDDGGWAIVVDRGAEISWLLEVHGVDQATATELGAALAVVEG